MKKNTVSYKYQLIIDYIKKNIKEGNFDKGQPIATEKQLSDLFNVSMITSKRAVVELQRAGVLLRKRGVGSFVNPDYLLKNSTNKKNIAFVLPFIDADVGALDYINGISEQANARGYSLNIINTMNNSKKEQETITEILNGAYDGTIIYPMPATDKTFSLFYQLYLSKKPTVLIDKYFMNIPLPYVANDDVGSGATATKTLIEYGHSRIAFLTPMSILNTSSICDRFLGYLNALNENGIRYDPQLCFSNFFNALELGVEDVYISIAKEIHKTDATGVLCSDGVVASHLLSACSKLDIKIPEQLSIVGFDKNIFTEHLSVPLTTISQNFKQVGAKAAEMLINIIEGKANEANEITLPFEMVIRKSLNNIKELKN